ncbi:MAG: TrkH family potassium uptake protein [Clostridia bacterium]|nr:TrkH family potassium uptake protein [Clostridia bacterium]MBQ2327365.1 TrkH family potassium uptake protein [Clostridia bacterium]MBQ5813340.1 TrkH family potassium uptake protein [Clostridia bacterium]
MNRRIVYYTTGKIFKALAALLLLPALVALWYRERTLVHILVSSGIAYLAGTLLTRRKPEDIAIYAKEGFAIVALAWIGLSALGALPFWLSGTIPSYIDALFETVSGFTTTGASIMPGVEHVSRALLFWRSFTHWVGGMGVLVFVMAIIPLSERRSMHIMRAEVPGPTSGKLLPRMRDTAKVLYTIYLVLSIVMFICLILAGMPVFDSAIHTFGTAGTGGFSCKNSSIAFYDSALIDWIIAVFMALFGVNFNLYYYLLIRNYKSAFKNEELWWYFGIMAFFSVSIAINIIPLKGSFLNALRYSFFQVSTLMTTTGYATANYDLWPAFSKTMLVLAMFIGASAGSTGGGLKVSRLMILGKAAKTEIKRMLHPRMVSTVTVDEKPVSDSTITGAYVYIVVYFLIAAVSVVLLSLDGFDFETNFTAMAACFNNIGPGLAKVGPICNYSEYSVLSKIVLILDMLLGRLEIFPMLFGLAFPFWKGHRKTNAKRARTANISNEN